MSKFKLNICYYLCIYINRNGITAHAKLPLILLKFCNKIAAGMTYLSGKQFVHRYLAARNILVSNKIVCKVINYM